ncbi:MAG: hypothetical protein ACOX0T_07525 [Pelotomaculum sp.]
MAEELSGGHLARMLLEDPLSAGIFAGGMVFAGAGVGGARPP